MHPLSAATLAHRLMDEHGLRTAGWRFQWNHRKSALGICHYRSRTIQLSLPMVRQHPEEVRETILHEIAHALAGHAAAHGPVWKAHARRIGAQPIATFKPSKSSP